MVGLHSVDPGGGGSCWICSMDAFLLVSWLVFLLSFLSLVGAAEVGFFF